MALSAKGQALSQPQIATARALITAGKTLNAPGLALEAAIFAAIMESNLGIDLGWDSSNPTFGGPLAGNVQYFSPFGSPGSAAVATAEANSFFKGGNGYQAGGAIAASAQFNDSGALAAAVEAPFDANDPPPYGQYLREGGIALINQVKGEAAAIVAAYGGGTLPGGTLGAGGTGTPANQPSNSLWHVGDTSNPDQDYWTTINQYSMDAQWYCFSDGETLFVADGIQLMAQRPQAVISRLDPAVRRVEATYDNTAFQFTATHRRKGHIQRRTSLARVVSPTEVTVEVICDIDQYRAGDTLILAADFGPAAGTWLIGECIRDVFTPVSELTLVQAMQPINAVSGTTTGPGFITGQQASAPTAGTVIAAMISEAATINNADYSYVWGGGHGAAGTPSIGQPGGNGFDGHTKGFDCSGAVGAVLGAGGIIPWGQPVAGDYGLIQQLLSAGKIVPGQGTGRPECTLFDRPGVHIFMRLNGEIFGTEDGVGTLPATPNQGAGWIPTGQAGTFQPYHIPINILGQRASGG